MRQPDLQTRLFALALTILAGMLDGLAFLKLHGAFVSFMSGNSTAFAVNIATRTGAALVPGVLVACFVAGVVFGTLLGPRLGDARNARTLLLLAVLLALAALVAGEGGALPALGIAAFGMGLENTLAAEEGERVGITYVTGALVTFAQQFALALRGGDRWGWCPHLLSWLSLIAGGALGATLFVHIGMAVLWLAAAAALLLAGWSTLLPQR